MIFFIGVLGLVVASVLGYAQVTQSRAIAILAAAGQAAGIIGLFRLGEDYYRPLAFFIVGMLLGAAVGAVSRRGRSAERQRHSGDWTS